MKRWIVTVFAAASMALLSAGAAVAAGPTRAPLQPFVIDFPAGLVCDFPVRWQADFARGQMLIFPVDGNGNQVIQVAGPVKTAVSNTSTGASIQVVGGTRIRITVHADGTADAVGSGTNLLALLATDAGGPAMFLTHGVMRQQLDASFSAVATTFTGGPTTDLCAALE